ncbi:MAG: hypothetical protein VB085_11115 [Peptococcaceae bacterium]|nr:hypothetical protein [Peptococcaceae bacterium]
MKTIYNRNLALCSIVLGACNLIPIAVENRWYCILCFAVLGLPGILCAIPTLRATSAKALRTLAWVDFLSGSSILFLALSDFYAAVGGISAFNFIAAGGLILCGIWGLVVSTKKLGLSLVP